MIQKTTVMPYLPAFQRFPRAVRLYLFTDTLSCFTVEWGMYAVLLNLYLLRLGYTTTLIGLVNAAGALAIAFGCLLAGFVGRRWGSQRTIVGGLAMMVIGCALLPLAEFLPTAWQVGGLMAIYGFISLGLAFYNANIYPFVAEVTPPEDRHAVFAAAYALGFLAALAGNLVGGWLPTLFAHAHGMTLDQPAPYRDTLALAALFLIPTVFAMRSAQTAPVNRVTHPGGKQGKIPYQQIGWLAWARLLQVMAGGAVLLFLTVYLDEGLGVSTSAIGALLALGRLLAVLAALLAPRLLARWEQQRLILGATAGLALSLLPLILAPHWSTAALTFIGVAALTAIRAPAFVTYSLAAVAPQHRTTMSGACEMANGLGFALIGLSGGYIITAWGYRPFFVLSACLTAVGTFVFWWFCRVHAPAAWTNGEGARHTGLCA